MTQKIKNKGNQESIDVLKEWKWIILYIIFFPTFWGEKNDETYIRNKKIINTGSIIIVILGFLGCLLIAIKYPLNTFLTIICAVFGIYFCLLLYGISLMCLFSKNKKWYTEPIGILLFIVCFFISVLFLSNLAGLESSGSGGGRIHRVRIRL